MKRSLVAILLLLAAVTGSSPSSLAQRPAEKKVGEFHDILFFGPNRPVFLSVNLQIRGKGISELRELFAIDMMKSIDKDSDQKLNSQEARRIPALGRFGAAGVVADAWKQLDNAPQDNSLSKDEVVAHVDAAMGESFVIVVRRRATQAVELFPKLDANRDGQITAVEFRNAGAALRKLDRDEDQTFSMLELQPFRDPNAPQLVNVQGDKNTETPFSRIGEGHKLDGIAEKLLSRYDRLDDAAHLGRLTTKESGLKPEVLKQFDADGNGGLDVSELEALIKNPVPESVLVAKVPNPVIRRSTIAKIDETNRQIYDRIRKRQPFAMELAGSKVEFRAFGTGSQVRDSASFYMINFRRADADKNEYVEEQEFPAIGLPGATFAMVDFDGDKKVVLDEVKRYARQRATVSRLRIVWTIEDGGVSLFELLDANTDFRLSPREFIEALARVNDKDINQDGVLSGVELAGGYKVSLSTGQTQLFQQSQMTNPAMNRNTPPRLQGGGSGPTWFQRMDRNRDGDLSLDEFLGKPAAFAKLDVNDDRLIDLKEANQLGRKTD